MRRAGFALVFITFFVLLVFPLLSTFNPMEITGAGLMIAPVAGAATVPQTTVPLIQHGELERAVSASQQDAADTLYSLTPWCRYVAQASYLSFKLLNSEIGCDV